MSLKDQIINLQNDKSAADYELSLNKIEKFVTEGIQGSNYSDLLQLIAKRILFYREVETLRDLSVEKYKEISCELYDELRPENYGQSYANPSYSESKFPGMGGLISFFYSQYRAYFSYAKHHMQFKMTKYNLQFLDFIAAVKEERTSFDELKAVVTKVSTDLDHASISLDNLGVFDPEYSSNYSIIMNSDLNDVSYLYRFGKYVSDNELRTAEFFKEYSDEKVKKVAKTIVDGYVRSFELEKKDLSIKDRVLLYFNLGQEKLTREIIKLLEKRNLTPLVNLSLSTDVNKQFAYDHRFDNALFLTQEYCDKRLEMTKEVYEEQKAMISGYSGVIYIEKFGEVPFSPESKDSCLKLNEDQQKIFQTFSNSARQLKNSYTPSTETSFCIVAFPMPEIGDRFEEIFEDTLEVNMMDTHHFESIQQKLVDTMDKADFVHVKGLGSNKTDIKVKMQKLVDPTAHTNFVNCGADVNIPVGEVFTSPALTGTNGVLHVSEIFLDGLKYIDLEIKFVDGYATEYTCKNFEDEEKNVKFVQENLMFPHKELPLGEFAIGTNTLAYVMAKKYDILDKLPILIVEKMGPHFAVGDTCFSWREDQKAFNPIDNKEITARDNERSILRKEDIQKAYTGCHTDITLPYEELDFISAVTSSGESFDVLRNGRFVVPGTEELNIPLDKE